MTDIIDKTNTTEQRILDMQIEAARNTKRTLKHVGSCHWCAEPVEVPKLFCDGVCAASHGRFER